MITTKKKRPFLHLECTLKKNSENYRVWTKKIKTAQDFGSKFGGEKLLVFFIKVIIIDKLN